MPVTTTGLTEFRAAGSRLRSTARTVSQRTSQASARRMADDMRARLAQRTHGTGKTAAAIDVQIGAGSEGTVRIVVRAVAGRSPRLPFYLEYGTVNMAARPFIRPALEAGRPQHDADQAAAGERALQELFT